MDARAWKTVGKGVAIAAAYCATFLVLWQHSYDQWYLPAGLRIASLLLLPMRYWPYVFAGDAVALLELRAPKAEQYSPQWAYLSPFLLVTAISVVPFYIRKKLINDQFILKRLPLIAAVASIWSVIAGRIINIALDGPTPPFTAERFIGFGVGGYLGILMVMLPCLLWQQRHEWRNTHRQISQTLAVSLLMVSTLYGSAMIPIEAGSAIRLMPLIFMLLPLTYMTILHGWHGAAIGTLLINFAIALALPSIPMIGSSDSIVLIAQTALAAVSAALLAMGVRISNLHSRSGDYLRDEILIMRMQQHYADHEAKTMGAVRAMFQSFERRFREKALLLAYARDDLDAYRNAVAQTLKDEGLYRQAMDAMSSGVESARALARHSELLYPFEIETYGLYAVLTSESFAERWKGRARLRLVLIGRSPSRLSVPLQLAAYRAICSAMDVLAMMAPTEVTIQTRGWCRRGHRGITIFVDCIPTAEFVRMPEIESALQELEVLARAYGGASKHRQTHRIGILLSEPGQSA
jgi:hypothetical protein